MLINGSTINGAPINGSSSAPAVEPEYVVRGIGYRWRLRVMVGGVDMTGQLTGSADIDREEGAAGVGSIALYLPPGPVVPTDWIGRAVTIDYISTTSGITTEARRFTGQIASPVWNPLNRVLSCELSDQLQQRVEALSIAEIDTLTGGYWSADVFEPTEGRSHWDYAQERMSTRTASLDCSPTGELRVHSWYATSPDFVFGPGTTLDNSLSVQLPDLGDLTNVVEIEADYRYARLRQRNDYYEWIGGGFCNWYFPETNELPTIGMIQEAVEKVGGTLLDSYSWDILPPSHPDPCANDIPWVNVYTDLLLGASFISGRRWAQAITERYPLRVEVTASIAVVGEVIERISGALEVETAAAETWAETPFTDGFNSHTDERDEPRRLLFLEVLLHQATAKVVSAHRETTVSWQVPTSMAMGIDLTHTLELDDQGCRALGRVRRIVDGYDFVAGTAITTISIAVMRGGGAITDPLTPPASVDEPQPGPGWATTILPTQLGGHDDSPPYDDELTGFAGNYALVHPLAEPYPRRFDIVASEIAADKRDELIVPIAQTYRVAIPNDLLEL